MTCCNCAGSPDTVTSAGTSSMMSSISGGSEARSSEAVSSNRTRTCTGRTRASRRRPKVRILSTRSRPRSAARRISSTCSASLVPGVSCGSTISEKPRMAPIILLKLCAMPLASAPIICIRRARSSRVVSLARSRSRNSRSMALDTASPASRRTGGGNTSSHPGRTVPKVSNPMMPRTTLGWTSGTQTQPRTLGRRRARSLRSSGRQGLDIGDGDDIRFGRTKFVMTMPVA